MENEVGHVAGGFIPLVRRLGCHIRIHVEVRYRFVELKRGMSVGAHHRDGGVQPLI